MTAALPFAAMTSSASAPAASDLIASSFALHASSSVIASLHFFCSSVFIIAFHRSSHFVHLLSSRFTSMFITCRFIHPYHHLALFLSSQSLFLSLRFIISFTRSALVIKPRRITPLLFAIDCSSQLSITLITSFIFTIVLHLSCSLLITSFAFIIIRIVITCLHRVLLFFHHQLSASSS